MANLSLQSLANELKNQLSEGNIDVASLNKLLWPVTTLQLLGPLRRSSRRQDYPRSLSTTSDEASLSAVDNILKGKSRGKSGETSQNVDLGVREDCCYRKGDC